VFKYEDINNKTVPSNQIQTQMLTPT